jgi:hypothetical protein
MPYFPSVHPALRVNCLMICILLIFFAAMKLFGHAVLQFLWSFKYNDLASFLSITIFNRHSKESDVQEVGRQFPLCEVAQEEHGNHKQFVQIHYCVPKI